MQSGFAQGVFRRKAMPYSFMPERVTFKDTDRFSSQEVVPLNFERPACERSYTWISSKPINRQEEAGRLVDYVLRDIMYKPATTKQTCLTTLA